MRANPSSEQSVRWHEPTQSAKGCGDIHSAMVAGTERVLLETSRVVHNSCVRPKCRSGGDGEVVQASHWPFSPASPAFRKKADRAASYACSAALSAMPSPERGSTSTAPVSELRRNSRLGTPLRADALTVESVPTTETFVPAVT